MAFVLVVSILVTFLAGRQVLVARDQIQQHDAVLAQLQATFSAIQDAETGQRGYLLTGDGPYLDPYRTANQAIRKHLDGLRELADAGQLPAPAVQVLHDVILRKVDEMQRTIDFAEAGQRAAAMAIVRRNTGRKMMEAIRAQIDALETEEGRARSRAHEADARATMQRTVVFVFAALVNLAFLVWTYKRIRREVSLQHLATLEIERQREILAVTLASIGDAVILTDLTGHITFVNQVAEDLTGWTASEAKGQPCAKVFRIINEDSRKPVDSPVEKVLASGAIVGLANHTLLIRKDGSELPIDDSGAPIRETDGSVRGVVLVFRDFTSHKETERHLVQAKQQVEEASRAKDKFLATLSHDLRTPLTPVLAALSTWEANEALPEALRPDLRLIRRNIELEAKLIDDLLDITRIEHGKLFLERDTTDVHGLIEGVIAIFKPACEANGVEISLSARAGETHAHVDPARLQQVFWNIIGNAVKFTMKGDRITVTTRNLPGEKLEISIADTGVGMTRETMDILFQSFRQGNPAPHHKPRGLGLGLSIADALVEAHGGTLRADSPGPGKGSTFTIVLPAVPSPAAQVQPVPRETAAGRSLRILLLEDHEDTARVLGQVLGGIGHTVETCGTVAAALEKISDAKFDLILSDLGLPDGSGLDFVRAVREASQVPAVALTGYGMSEDIEECLEAGFDEHLTKPVDFEKLQMALRTQRRTARE
ncbi:MAG: CHASE3 domain-containing protein [Terrimicrobiaceae bacterium]|nr:CHASE3 domain-containing protein [Terrimicrobiaceae bacterium]